MRGGKGSTELGDAAGKKANPPTLTQHPCPPSQPPIHPAPTDPADHTPPRHPPRCMTGRPMSHSTPDWATSGSASSS